MLFLDMSIELFLVAITSELVQVPRVIPNAKSAFPSLVRHVPILVDIDIMPRKTLKVGNIGLAELALDWHLFVERIGIALLLSLLDYLINFSFHSLMGIDKIIRDKIMIGNL